MISLNKDVLNLDLHVLADILGPEYRCGVDAFRLTLSRVVKLTCVLNQKFRCRISRETDLLMLNRSRVCRTVLDEGCDVMGANTNTVLRALRLLREEGLLEFRRGRGITVAGTPEKGAVLAKLNELLVFARSQGYQSEELTAMIKGLEQ